MKSRLLAVALVALAFPPVAMARGVFDPTTEFEQHEWVPIHLGPLDLSITKAVVYLMIGTALTIAFGLLLMRWHVGVQPGVRQTIGEQLYEIAEVQKPAGLTAPIGRINAPTPTLPLDPGETGTFMVWLGGFEPAEYVVARDSPTEDSVEVPWAG